MTNMAVANSDEIKKVNSLIKGIHVAMLVTALPDGSLRSRPMATQQADFDGTLWFFTDAESTKVHEVEGEGHVNLTYMHPGKQHYVSISGRASVVRDHAKAAELWSPVHRAWFPKGLDDPELALLKVDVDVAEYWDSPSSMVVHIFGLAKALLTGERYTPGENKKVML